MSDGTTSPAHSKGSQRAIIGAAILLFAALSAYLALVIITRVDSLFFPGNQLTLPSSIGKALPGVDAEGTSGNQDRINILVLGLDRRPQEGDTPGRTDTIFVMTIDPKTKTTGILGIPRDLWIEIPGKGGYEERINTVYVTGELEDYPGGGIGMMKDALAAEPFNIKIDKHVIVDFLGFERIIDGLGGIDVDVPEYVNDPYYSWTELPGDYDPQEFEPGLQHMDGHTALAYSRIRFSSDDFDRIQRQQRVIFATIDKANNLNVLANATSLWSDYKDAISTDINDTLIPGYALLANQVKDDIYALSLGSATVPWTTPGGAQVLVGDPERIGIIVDSLFADQPGTGGGTGAPLVTEPTPDPVMVEIQNAAGIDGLAADVVAYLVERGYPLDDLNPANVFDGQAHDVSEIIDVDGTHERNGYQLASWLEISPERYRTATADEKAAMEASGASIMVILGGDVDFGTLIKSPTTSTPEG